ncbi:MAG TPA: PLP-dependent transferase, partial [Thermoanaerobaculia bacterium]|nr:PLP-dependent transferase [Thermoanaerobaculia bacterium]
MNFETLAVHAGHDADPATGSVAPPLHLSTNFARDPEGTPLGGHTYIRESNPNESQLEAALASLEGALEGGTAALVFASGMAAGIALLQTLPPGSHVVFPDDVYYGFRIAAGEYLPNWGISSTAVAMQDLREVEAALRPET